MWWFFCEKKNHFNNVDLHNHYRSFLFCVCGRLGGPFRHLSFSGWHFSEDENCTPDLLTIYLLCWHLTCNTDILVIIKEDHLKSSVTQCLSVDQQKETILLMCCLMLTVHFISRLAQPYIVASSHTWLLSTWNVAILNWNSTETVL